MDINCDVGESYGHFKIGQDEALFPYINSCNIACGFHAGDPLTIQKTIEAALKHKLKIGAHPSYPDLVGFGRRKMTLSKEELIASILYQVGALKSMVESFGGRLNYVKPHGALYNTMAQNETEAFAVIEAIQLLDDNLALMGLANSPLEQWANQKGIRFIPEAFADRGYTINGQLMARNKEGALLIKPIDVLEQVTYIIKEKRVKTKEGFLSIDAQSICIHGDNPRALDILKCLQKANL
jgi:UPF0271 protein